MTYHNVLKALFVTESGNSDLRHQKYLTSEDLGAKMLLLLV